MERTTIERVSDMMHRYGKSVCFSIVFHAFVSAALPAGMVLFQCAPALADGEKTGRIEIPLARLAGYPVAKLTGARSNITVKIPVARRCRIDKAELDIAYKNSTALLKDRSRIIVTLNGYALEQIELHPESWRGETKVTLPPVLLLPGYNELDFLVTQNYTERCSDPDAPELWTDIELDRSVLTIDYALNPVPLSLASVVDYLFDPKTLESPEVNIILESDEPDRLYSAALAAAAVSMRFQYRPVRFSLSSDLAEGEDNILIGKSDFVTKFFESKGVSFPGGNLSVMHMPDKKDTPDTGRALIVLTGDTQEALDEAVKAFSILNFPLPASQSASFKEVTVPPVHRYSVSRMLQPGKTYSFEDLGFETQSRKGFKPYPMELSFKAPSDIFIKENDYATLTLHLAYGAMMRSDSVLNVFMNGAFVSAIPLDDQRGGRYRGYRADVPLEAFKRGANRLTLVPVLTPSQTEECAYFQTENLIVTLFGDSKIKLPATQHWVEMPQMELFFQDGFPFAKQPDWKETTVLLSERDMNTASAAINLVAAICQKNAIAPYGIRFAYELLKEETELIAVGAVDKLSKELLDASPVSPMVPYPFNSGLGDGSPPENWWRKILNWKSSEEKPRSEEAKAQVPLALGNGKLMLLEFESPFHVARSVLLVTATGSEDLLKGVFAMSDPAVHYKAKGNVILLDMNDPEPRIYTQRTDDLYFVGKAGSFRALDRLIFEHPWVLYVIVVAAILLLAWILWIFLRRMGRKRTGASESGGGGNA